MFSQSIAVQICFTSVGFGLGAWDIVSFTKLFNIGLCCTCWMPNGGRDTVACSLGLMA